MNNQLAGYANQQASVNTDGTRPPTEIESRETGLMSAIDHLNDSLERLASKLSKVLEPESPSPALKEEDSGSIRCPMSAFLAQEEARVRSLHRWVENITARCQL